jgi:hypothetical protein
MKFFFIDDQVFLHKLINMNHLLVSKAENQGDYLQLVESIFTEIISLPNYFQLLKGNLEILIFMRLLM